MMTLDVICSTAFGVEVNSCKNPDAEILRKAREALEEFNTGNTLLLLAFIFPSFGKLLDLLHVYSTDWRYFEKFTAHLISQRKELTEKSGHDFVNILLKEKEGAGQGLSDKEIIANAVLFLLSAYETTSGSLSFFLYNLAVYPDCQERAYQEIKDVIGDQDPTYENVRQLCYLEMCLNESLRLFPVVARTKRLCVKDTVVKGVAIEKGISVVLPIWQMHTDPEIWDDPETFNPERFTPEKKKDRDPLDYVPFGLGPRHCIAMRLALLELKIAAVRILQKFMVVRNAKTEVPLEFYPHWSGITAKNGIWLSLERRS